MKKSIILIFSLLYGFGFSAETPNVKINAYKFVKELSPGGEDMLRVQILITNYGKDVVRLPTKGIGPVLIIHENDATFWFGVNPPEIRGTTVVFSPCHFEIVELRRGESVIIETSEKMTADLNFHVVFEVKDQIANRYEMTPCRLDTIVTDESFFAKDLSPNQADGITGRE